MTKIASSAAVSLTFSEYPELHGDLIAATELGELWEFEGSRCLLESADNGRRWTLTSFEFLDGHQRKIVESIKKCLETGTDVSLCNYEATVKIKTDWDKPPTPVVFHAFIFGMTDDGLIYRVWNGPRYADVLVPKHRRTPCSCGCPDFAAQYEEEMDSGEDAEFGDPYECEHIKAVAGLDEHREDRRIRRSDPFEPCEYWN